MGITRVANVTGLDRIGIPVVMVVRPNARSLAVAQGKGTTLAAAQASGVMESVETYHAERAHLPIWIDSFSHLSGDRGVPVAAPGLLPRPRHSGYAPDRSLPWVEATDLVAGVPTWVPFELVHANFTVPRVPGSGCFLASTNGLASGNTRTEAVLHGLCEVIERDASALWAQAPDRAGRSRLDLATVDDAVCASLIERFQRAGVSLVAWNLTSNVPVAVFRVVVFERAADPVLRPMPAAAGVGCHPDRTVALARALTEAAQSRLTQIAGARDDMTRSVYAGAQHPDALSAARTGTDAAWAGGVDFTTVVSTPSPSAESDLDHVVAALRPAGVGNPLVVDLSAPEVPATVVRVIVPGLEGPHTSPSYTPGGRAGRARSVDREP